MLYLIKKFGILLYLQEKIISARLIKIFIQKSFANCTTIKRERQRKKKKFDNDYQPKIERGERIIKILIKYRKKKKLFINKINKINNHFQNNYYYELIKNFTIIYYKDLFLIKFFFWSSIYQIYPKNFFSFLVFF